MTTRPTLPQNCQVHVPEENFSIANVNDWSISGTGAYVGVDSDETHAMPGEVAQKFSIAPGQYVLLSKSISAKTFANHRFRMTVHHDGTDTLHSPAVSMWFSSVGDFSKYIKLQHQPGVRTTGVIFDANTGAQFTVGDETWDNPIIRVRLKLESQAAGNTTEITISGLYDNVENIPCVMLTFDDTKISEYANAVPLMDALGIHGTFYINPAQVGLSERMTLANLQEMYVSGHDIANHGYSHADMSTLTQEQNETLIQDAIDYLEENNMPRGAYHFAYPYGKYDEDVLVAVAAKNILTGRGTSAHYWDIPPNASMHTLRVIGISSTTTVSSVCSQLARALTSGASVIFEFHDIETPESLSTSWTVEKFTEFLNYLYSQRARCRILSMSEWYNGLTNPRYRSLPVTRAVV